MRLLVKRLSFRDVDYELALGVLFIPLCAAAAWAVAHLPTRFEPICTLHAVSGYPCPTCGTLRCIRHALAGRLGDAFVTQPFVAALMAVALAYSLYSWVVVVGRLPRIRPMHAPRALAWWVGAATVAALLVNWVYLVLDGR